jgi:uncharacterized membrane protein YphA (DoxX/SURF4 family)
MKLGFLVGRVIAGAFYIYSGIRHFTNLSGMSGYTRSKGVPLPMLAVAGAGVLLIAGGVSLILGWYPRLGVAALALFLLGVTPVMHNFWAIAADQRAAQQGNFLKNMALLGSALMFLAIPEPWPWGLGPKKTSPRGRLGAERETDGDE